MGPQLVSFGGVTPEDPRNPPFHDDSRTGVWVLQVHHDPGLGIGIPAHNLSPVGALTLTLSNFGGDSPWGPLQPRVPNWGWGRCASLGGSRPPILGVTIESHQVSPQLVSFGGVTPKDPRNPPFHDDPKTGGWVLQVHHDPAPPGGVPAQNLITVGALSHADPTPTR